MQDAAAGSDGPLPLGTIFSNFMVAFSLGSIIYNGLLARASHTLISPTSSPASSRTALSADPRLSPTSSTSSTLFSTSSELQAIDDEIAQLEKAGGKANHAPRVVAVENDLPFSPYRTPSILFHVGPDVFEFVTMLTRWDRGSFVRSSCWSRQSLWQRVLLLQHLNIDSTVSSSSNWPLDCTVRLFPSSLHPRLTHHYLRPDFGNSTKRNGTGRSARDYLIIIPSSDESPRHARSRLWDGRKADDDLYYLLSLPRGG